jgi:ribosomal protein S12 methylthiotransferase accessory factor
VRGGDHAASGAAKHDLGGTLRARGAAETLAWLRPLLPRFGITRLANVTGLDHIGIPVWMCVRPNGRSLSVAQGKGVTTELAQASALMESIETFHAERLPPPDLIASYRTARRRHDVVSPASIAPGYRRRAYHPARDICWIRGTDLATREPVLVPHMAVNLNFSHAHPDAGLFRATSSGLASGNGLSEALCHAIFEVIERDCEWRWERLSPAAQRGRLLNSDTVDSPVLRALLDQFARAEVSVLMWDMTSTVGIPAFGCSIDGPGPLGLTGPYGGFGCHLSAEIALARALTEAAQSRVTFIAGSRDDMYPWDYVTGRSDGLSRPGQPPARSFRDAASPPLGATFDDDLRTILRLLDAAGFPRVVAIDLTRPEYGVPVVVAIVPGMHETD